MASWGRADFEAFRNIQEKIQSLKDIEEKLPKQLDWVGYRALKILI